MPIIHYTMPHFSGTDALRLLREKGFDIPFIFVSGTIGEDTAVAAMKNGANDYTVKGNLRRLIPAIERELRETEVRRARKLAEEALRESEKRYHTLFETSPDFIGLFDLKLNLLMANKPALMALGYQKVEELIGKNALEFVSQEDHHRILEDLPRVLELGIIRNREYELLKKDGTTFSAEVNASVIMDAEGKPIAVLTVFRDITERKKAEEVRAFLANITEHATDAIEGIDLDTNIVSWNSGAEKLFGYSAQEVIGRPHSLIVPKEAQDDCRERFKKATIEGFVRAETDRIKRDGSLFPVDMALTELKDEKGEHIGFVCITRDITERKKLEEQLRQSQKMEAIGQLAGGIAHDFNNILNVIMGFGSLIEMNMKEDDPNRIHLKEILLAGERAVHLTQGLLAFSRKQIIDPKPQNLNEIIKEVEKFLIRLIGEDIELKTSLADKDLIAMVDGNQMQQLLMNLATNARDAMPKGGALFIETRLVALDEEFIRRHGDGKAGRYARISFSDTGIGMDKATRERIFEPFFTTKELGKGTGLGLAMVYGIIKQHNGLINVYSELGKGTTFKIYLPLIQSEAEDIRPKEAMHPSPLPKGTEMILVAEDDAAVRMLTKNALEKYGYKVIEAEDGEDAAARFRENKDKIQLVILDAIMPKKNGREAYDEIKRMRSDIKVIFTSGYTADMIHKKGILDKGLNFVIKPISPRLLLEKVRETLDRKEDIS